MEDMLDEAEKRGLYVMEKVNFDSTSKGLIKGDVIGINKNIKTSAERRCVLAEEIAHYDLSVGNIISTNDQGNSKQEYLARMNSYNRVVGLFGIIDAYKHKCRNAYEISDYLNVTTEFLSEALTEYKNKYGQFVNIDNYTIYFEPYLGVMERF